MGKITFLAGFAAGYVLGARAGRQRYEQIKTGANKVWSSDPVQARVGDVAQAAKSKAAPFVADKLGDAAKAASRAMKERAHGEQPAPSLQNGRNGRIPADTSGFGPGSRHLN